MEDQTGMQPAAPQAAPAVPVVKQVKELLSQDKIKEKFGEVLGQKAPQFMASITNTVSGSAQLKKCPANSIIGAAFVAATYDLPIDSNLGFAAIVPYNESVWNPKKKDWEKVPKAQFQMMYKGFIQLAIRSGYYERMNYAVVYKDVTRPKQASFVHFCTTSGAFRFVHCLIYKVHAPCGIFVIILRYASYVKH